MFSCNTHSILPHPISTTSPSPSLELIISTLEFLADSEKNVQSKLSTINKCFVSCIQCPGPEGGYSQCMHTYIYPSKKKRPQREITNFSYCSFCIIHMFFYSGAKL
jgi:hypothetical protein